MQRSSWPTVSIWPARSIQNLKITREEPDSTKMCCILYYLSSKLSLSWSMEISFHLIATILEIKLRTFFVTMIDHWWVVFIWSWRSYRNRRNMNVFLLGVWLGFLVLVPIGIIRPLYTTHCEYHTTWRLPVYSRLFFPYCYIVVFIVWLLLIFLGL